jgi:hypothetical protein
MHKPEPSSGELKINGAFRVALRHIAALLAAAILSQLTWR